MKRRLLKLFIFGISLGIILFLGLVFYIANPTKQDLIVPPELVPQMTVITNSTPGISPFLSDYPSLVTNLESQIYRSFCGVASSVMVLKALGKNVSQKSFFSHSNLSYLSRIKTFFIGMTLSELSGYLTAHDVNVDTIYGSDITLEALRSLIKNNLSTEGNYLIANYSRTSLAQQNGGHISPVAAYNEQADEVLILDVATYKYPPVWVKLTLLHKSIQTIDSVSGKSRGLVEVF